MSSQGFIERILEIFQDGTALTASTAATDIMPAAHKTAALPIGFFDRLPRAIMFLISGRISNVVTTPGTLRLELMYGSVAILDSGLMPLNVVAKTNVHWTLQGQLVPRAVGGGTSTTFFPKGCSFESHSVIGAPDPTAGGAGRILLPYNTAPAVGAGIDNGVAAVFGLRATWSLNNANSIQVQAGHIDVLN